MASTCTIVIPLSDLDLVDSKTLPNQRGIHNMDINFCPDLKQCDISLEKDGQTLPLTATQTDNAVNLEVTNKAWNDRWKDDIGSESAKWLGEHSSDVVTGATSEKHSQGVTHAPGSRRDWSRSQSLDGVTDPSMVRLARERRRLTERMRSMSLERSRDCWGRERSVENEVIIHGEAPIHDAAKHVIKQVDALLADLQSTTSHIAAHQQEQQQQHPAPTYQHHTVTKTTKISTELPADNSPAKHNQDTTDGQPVYEPQIVKTVKRSQTETTSTSVSRTQYNINPLPLANTNGVTSGQHALPPSGETKAMTPLSNNLSELDSLLQDLSSAQFMAEVDRRNAANTGEVDSHPRNQSRDGRDRTVDSLLYELESFVPPNRPADDGGSHYELVRPVHGASTHTPGPASSATRELDDLMASLSEFKQQGGPKHVGDPPYATVNKTSRQAFVAENSVQHQKQTSHASAQQAGLSDSSGGQDQQNNNLETMLGNLSTDMSRQGIMTIPKGHCAACAKPIIGQVITALGKIWHPEHFVCGHCKEPLGTRNFFERDDLPFCERDYHMLFSPRCAQCNCAILDKCITALDKTWHPEHFVCAECGRQFGDAGFHEKDGKAYCRDDYFNMFAPRCAGCNQPIMDNFISALNRQWHPECFVCYECHMPFGSTSFFDHEGYPYCETHYHAKRGSLCAGCHKPITGRCITAMYKKFHPEHFVCAFCLKQLNKGTFKEENDKPYCHPCFAKLFG